MESFLIRCRKCGAANRIKKDKIKSNPKCGKCSSHIAVPQSPINATGLSYNTEVLSEPGVVLVAFWSPSCGHCRQLNPVLDQIAREMTGAVKIVKINIQQEGQLAQRFDIRGVPTLMLYRSGKKINEIAGALPKEQLTSWILSSS